MPSASRNRIPTGTCASSSHPRPPANAPDRGPCSASSRAGPDPDEATDWQTRQHQYDAVCAWGEPNHALLQRLSAIEQPVFVANGDSDPMILPHYSYLLAGLIPHARLKIYPDAAHGFLFQHHDEFAADVDAFLADASAHRDGQVPT